MTTAAEALELATRLMGKQPQKLFRENSAEWEILIIHLREQAAAAQKTAAQTRSFATEET